MSGNNLVKLLSSITSRLNRTLGFITLDAAGRGQLQISPSCFLEVIVHRAAFPLIRFPSMMKPEPNRSDSSVNTPDGFGPV